MGDREYAETDQAWNVAACGCKYTAPKATNNLSEYEALREGIVHSVARFSNQQVHFQVFGDSMMIITQMTGWSATNAPHLAPIAARIKHLCGQMVWVTWNHVGRKHNKMADFLANCATETKTSKTLTPEPGPLHQGKLEEVRALLSNDIQGTLTQAEETAFVYIF